MKTKLFTNPGRMIVVCLACQPLWVTALPVNLGSAGPGNWAVLQIGTGKIDMSNPAGVAAGNVGVNGSGEIASSGPIIQGNVYLGTGADVNPNVLTPGRVTGSIISGAGADPLLAQARTDALAAAAAAKLLSGSSIANITANQTLSAGVYFLSKIDLNGETLTLSGGLGDSFVFNISDDFKLNGSDILLTGGLLPQNVLFNYYGTHDLSFSGGGNASELHGIILAPDNKVTLSPGLVVGEIISGDDISIVSGAQVQGIAVPETSATLLLSFIGFGLLAFFRTRIQRA